MNKLLFLLDYDGTLTDFTRDPEHSPLTASQRNLLRKLQRKHPVILVSGRHIDGLKRVSGIRRFPMVGTHGFEARYLRTLSLSNGRRDIKLATPAQEKRFGSEAARLWKGLQALKREWPFIFIEKKPFSSTVHYRDVPLSPARERNLRKGFDRIFKQCVTPKFWMVMKGKKMIEAMPKGFNKGKAVKTILKRFPDYKPVYGGDDITDISVFKVLGKKGIRVAVGNRIPRRYYDFKFANPRAFMAWLKHFV
jgi:trehalose 6-phosphate phosphatase